MAKFIEFNVMGNASSYLNTKHLINVDLITEIKQTAAQTLLVQFKCIGVIFSGHNNQLMKSQGLGDSIEKFTTKTGIKTIVDSVSEGLNIPCGCQQRKDALNKMFPYSTRK